MSEKQKKKLARILACALLFAAACIADGRGALDGWVRFGVFFLMYLVTGWDVLSRAIRNIRNGQVFDENFLMTIATLGALAIGEYPEAVAVMLFYQVGELFQSYAVGKSRKSISELMDIRPDYANMEKNGVLTRVNPDTVRIGDVVVVKPGERVPLDGVVLSGNSSVNTAALTGESLPRDIREGDSILSGCVNLRGVLRVRCEKPFEESTAQRILDLVENASEKKARTENLITRFARYYTPLVVLTAILLAALPPLIMGGWTTWINRALIFLVISCPCALVISVPLSFFGGIGGASRQGVLIKGGNDLEALAAVDTLAIDKTGTLTQGSFTVTATDPISIREDQLIEYAALAECFSDHPIALSLKAAYARPIDGARVRNVREFSGLGISAEVNGDQILVGNETLMNERGIRWRAPSVRGTVAHVAVNGECVGSIAIGDTIKPDATAAILTLRRMGISRIVMLTGDSAEAGERVAALTGIDEAHCQLLPQGKVDCVEQLMERPGRKGKLCFVGDGINDAPVLRRADVGIAMGALGSAAAIEAADVVLMHDRLDGVAKAIGIARRTLGIARQNIAFALGVKALFLIFGAFGAVGMWEAVFADVGVSAIAILNAMRAMRS